MIKASYFNKEQKLILLVNCLLVSLELGLLLPAPEVGRGCWGDQSGRFVVVFSIVDVELPIFGGVPIVVSRGGHDAGGDGGRQQVAVVVVAAVAAVVGRRRHCGRGHLYVFFLSLFFTCQLVCKRKEKKKNFFL